MRLIDADAVWERYHKEYRQQDIYDGMQDKDWLERCINEAPTVDAEPTRYGKWIEVGSLSCRCDQCGCKNNRESNYCPNCGARMDGDKQ